MQRLKMSEVVNMRLTPVMLDRVRQTARSHGLTLQGAYRQALHEWVSRHGTSNGKTTDHTPGDDHDQ